MTPARTIINGRYELDPLPLAKGGMVEVWTGRDVKLEREVAVKFVRFPDDQPDQELIRRFVRESRITARLEHPGVPAVYDVGTHDGRPYLVMQRIHGVSVADLVAEHHPLPVAWAATIAAQTCSVLAAAHAASLIHRDLKPANLMLDRDGGVKVLDFGLAVGLDQAGYSQITRSGQTIGTPAYMAPEQIMASMSEPRSDLYALGCTLYHLLPGEAPYTGATIYAVMHQQVDQRPVPVREHRPEVPVDLDRLVLALMEKRPDDRPASASEVYQRLLPFVTSLTPLPGVLATHPHGSPARMYAAMLACVPDGTAVASPTTPSAPADARRPAPIRTRPSSPPPLSRAELARARSQASGLVRQSRYQQAADVVGGVLEPAVRAFGRADPEVVSLRREYADLLFEGGDYRRAAPQFRQLVDDLADRGAAPVELLSYRLREATCLALTGAVSHALRLMEELLADQRRLLPADDPRTLELRRQVALLKLGAGRRDDAQRELRQLGEDLARQYGVEHPTTREVRELLAGLPGPE